MAQPSPPPPPSPRAHPSELEGVAKDRFLTKPPVGSGTLPEPAGGDACTTVAPPPPRAHRSELQGVAKLMLVLSSIPASLFATFVVLRVFGLVCPFAIPTRAMVPAISPGDHVFMEGLTYLHRQPRRGDLAVFRTDGIAGLPQEQIYVKRVAGLPREQLSLSAGDLYINGKVVAVSNGTGRIVYSLPPFGALPITNTIVPARCYFVLGDNSTNSLDSRYWGCVPRQNIRGRILFCYWPLQRIGFVK